MYQCPNCASNIKFNIERQQMYCEFCETVIDPYQLEEKHKVSEYTETVPSQDGDNQTMQVTVYICSQCGGEIIGDENEAATFCSFCGASTMMNSRIDHTKKPASIIPFQITKDDCARSYKRLVRKAIFAPDYVKDPQKINGFRGIYMPYWLYDFEKKGSIRYAGEHEHRRGDYIYTDHYSIHAEVDYKYDGVEYDASSTFADSLSNAIAPFHARTRNPFTSAFISGFYADAKDVENDIYQDEATGIVAEHAAGQIKGSQKSMKYSIDNQSLVAALKVKPHTKELTMLPVWFMSYRTLDNTGREKILYSVVNGQTGKCAADLPVSIPKYVIGSVILALPLFLLYNVFLTITPSTLLFLSAVIMLLCKGYIVTKAHLIAVDQTGHNDRGFLAKNGFFSTPKGSKRNKPFQTPEPEETKVAPIRKKILQEVNGISRWFFYATIIAYVLLYFTKPVSDFYYYGGVILSGICNCLMFVSIVKIHNKLTFRPLPQFKRTGGDDSANFSQNI